ncbi:hypothetical protein V6N11_008812 [Hibiscus sabdariffa]|uniref:Uncharacterized protein n=1 Tax=Hibiscus sabdariffa TaxID=183260 RepID=A0ABR2NQR3_9ROSI
MENPKVLENPNMEVLERSNGRPLDAVEPVGDLPVLERSESPLISVNPRTLKKPRSEVPSINSITAILADGGIYDGVSDMEACVDAAVNMGGGVTMSDTGKAGDMRGISKAEEERSLNIDDVEVLDEDWVVYEAGVFPTITFSECDHEHIDKSLRNAIIVRLFGRNIVYAALLNKIHALWKPRVVPEPSKTVPMQREESARESGDLYGPWMMVTSSRRRQNQEGGIERGIVDEQDKGKGVIRNGTEGTGRSEDWSAPVGNATKSAVKQPLRGRDRKGRPHSTIRLSAAGNVRRSGLRVKSLPVGFKVGKSKNGGDVRGPLGKASLGYRSPSKTPTSEWIHAADERIDAMVHAKNVVNGVGIRGMEEDDPSLGLQIGGDNAPMILEDSIADRVLGPSGDALSS